ncbi:PREDICTED: cysteine-rich and transmembrane domain-containing protein A-like [Nicotiana attenuata]|uniref:cysteine-rich and transmembrane domain-containing protein A-like n=1 Tax=Nicotiana attenuata TaxID=49451 RepID=UPI000905C2FB|nr:PREDICTED: cysteine-rich and transmembrane domain-containing protein A-like [Nicotiana attenuata]
MSSYNNNQSQGTYPPQGTACPYPKQAQGAYVAPPPPAGYQTREYGHGDSSVPAKTQTRGDGFWKGCFAALCCCLVLDACF